MSQPPRPPLNVRFLGITLALIILGTWALASWLHPAVPHIPADFHYTR